MSHGSELPKVTSVYLETAEPIDWNSRVKLCTAWFRAASYFLYSAVAVTGEISPPLGGAAKFWPQNADFEPWEAPNNDNNSKRLQHYMTCRQR